MIDRGRGVSGGGKRAAVGVLVVAALAAATLGLGSALAASAVSIAISGPTKNVFHTNFNETVSGFASGAANYVISGEQLYPAGGCAASYTVEATRSDWFRWPTGVGPVRGSFSLVARFYARNHLVHGICSYLVNATTKQTYAHASRFWNNS